MTRMSEWHWHCDSDTAESDISTDLLNQQRSLWTLLFIIMEEEEKEEDGEGASLDGQT